MHEDARSSVTTQREKNALLLLLTDDSRWWYTVKFIMLNKLCLYFINFISHFFSVINSKTDVPMIISTGCSQGALLGSTPGTYAYFFMVLNCHILNKEKFPFEGKRMCRLDSKCYQLMCLTKILSIFFRFKCSVYTLKEINVNYCKPWDKQDPCIDIINSWISQNLHSYWP